MVFVDTMLWKRPTQIGWTLDFKVRKAEIGNGITLRSQYSFITIGMWMRRPIEISAVSQKGMKTIQSDFTNVLFWHSTDLIRDKETSGFVCLYVLNSSPKNNIKIFDSTWFVRAYLIFFQDKKKKGHLYQFVFRFGFLIGTNSFLNLS